MNICIRQHDVTDCAAACIASVARHYGRDIPLTVIREACGTSSAGTSIKGILDAGRHLGFLATAWKSDDRDTGSLAGIPLPAILHTVNKAGDLHFVVLCSAGGGKMTVMDPAEGKRIRYTDKELAAEWTGYLVVLQPDPEAPFKESPGRRRSLLLQAASCIPVREMTLMLAGSVVYIAAGLCTALFLQHIIDKAIPAGDPAGILQVSLLMAAVMACTLLVGYGRILYSLRIGITLDGRLILHYLRHLFRLPEGFFSRRGAGELNSRIGDAAKVRRFLVEGASTLLTGLLILVVSFTLMFTLHWRLALLMLTFVPVYLFLYIAADRVNKRVNRDIIEQSAVFEERTVEGITAARIFRHYGGGGEQLLRGIEREYYRLAGRIFNGGRKAGGLASGADGVAKLLTITLLTAGAYYISAGSLTVGELVSFYALSGWFSAPLGELVQLDGNYNEARIAAERLGDITQLEPEETGLEDFIPQPGEDVTFDHIGFSYPGAPELLKDFSMTLRHGTVTAVQGGSGSGKSTLAALLMRDYTVQKGCIRLGSHDIRLFSIEAWRRFAALVPQDPVLLNASILDNITCMSPRPDVARVTALLDELELGGFVQSLPMGIFTKVGERGAMVSGGQRQRIALARALYRSPSLLILDEATSSLDSRSQEALLGRIMRFRDEGGTVMMITHKADNAALADTIVTI